MLKMLYILKIWNLDLMERKKFEMAKVIADKLLNINPEYDYWKINKLQLVFRKRDLRGG